MDGYSDHPNIWREANGTVFKQNIDKFNFYLTTHHNVVPLVELDREISVRLDPFGVGRVHNRLTGWADGNGLGQLGVAGSCHPGHLRGKVGNMIFLFLKSCLRNEDWEVTILDAQFLYLSVEESLKRKVIFDLTFYQQHVIRI